MRATFTTAGELSSANRTLTFSTPSSTKAAFTTTYTADEASKPAPPLAVPREHAYRLCGLFLTGDWLVACAAIFTGLELREWQRVGWSPGSGTRLHVSSTVVLWSLGSGALFSWLMMMFKTYEVKNLYRTRKW